MVSNYEIYLLGQFIFFITLITLKNILTLIVAFFVSEMQRIFCEALVGTPIRFEITQNRLKMGKI
jgi:hypothetical protein